MTLTRKLGPQKIKVLHFSLQCSRSSSLVQTSLKWCTTFETCPTSRSTSTSAVMMSSGIPEMVRGRWSTLQGGV